MGKIQFKKRSIITTILVVIILIIMLFVLILKNNFNSKDEILGSNWMSRIDGNFKLNQINIPGTHDSGTYGLIGKFDNPSKRTQKLNIEKQLEQGIRYFDIRLWQFENEFDVGSNNNDIILSHEDVKCKDEKGEDLTLKKVLNICNKFLRDESHKFETIILHIKNEGKCLRSIQNNVQKIDCSNDRIEQVKRDIQDFNCFSENRIPKLDEVRGKIVIATRHNDYPGIYIPIESKAEAIDFNEYNCVDNNYKCRLQDSYELEKDNKWKAIEKLLLNQKDIPQGSSNDENVITINFVSTTMGNIKDVSEELNGKVMETLSKLDASKQYGWILTDFPSDELVHQIYIMNKINYS